MSMKKILLFCFCLMCVEIIYAQYMDSNWFMGAGTGTISGPVKKITVTCRHLNYPSDVMVNVVFFDTIGNIVKTGWYKEGKLIIDKIYRYGDNNSCMRYSYDENGKVENRYNKIYFDEKGRELLKFSYYKDDLILVDSLVYDKKGHLIAKYSSEYNKRTPLLRMVYSYDSIGRILEETNIKTGEHCAISYKKNGNYRKVIKKNGSTNVEEVTVNKAGQIIECRSEDKIDKYLRYDNHGNWLKYIGVLNTNSSVGMIGSEIERTIEYYE